MMWPTYDPETGNQNGEVPGVLATCRAANCFNADQPIEVSSEHDVYCGPCGVRITDLVPVVDPD